MTVFPPVFPHFFHLFSRVKIKSSDFGRRIKEKRKREIRENIEKRRDKTFGPLLNKYLKEILKKA